MDTLDLTGLWFCIALGLLAGAGWWVELRRSAIDRAERAESALAELRDRIMRGASVTTWHRRKPVPPRADEFYFHIKTTRGDLLLTEEAMAVALERAEKLLRHNA